MKNVTVPLPAIEEKKTFAVVGGVLRQSAVVLTATNSKLVLNTLAWNNVMGLGSCFVGLWDRSND